jgi:hypothetical protein
LKQYAAHSVSFSFRGVDKCKYSNRNVMVLLKPSRPTYRQRPPTHHRGLLRVKWRTHPRRACSRAPASRGQRRFRAHLSTECVARRLIPRAVVLSRPLRHLPMPALSGRERAAQFREQPWSRNHCSTSTRPPAAASAHGTSSLHGQPCSRAHFSAFTRPQVRAHKSSRFKGSGTPAPTSARSGALTERTVVEICSDRTALRAIRFLHQRICAENTYFKHRGAGCSPVLPHNLLSTGSWSAAATAAQPDLCEPPRPSALRGETLNRVPSVAVVRR